MFIKLLIQNKILHILSAVAVADAAVNYESKKFDCVSDVVKELCLKRCGLNHYCLLGKCFCGEEVSTSNELDTSILQPDESSPIAVPQLDKVLVHPLTNADLDLIRTALNLNTNIPRATLLSDSLGSVPHSDISPHKGRLHNLYSSTVPKSSARPVSPSRNLPRDPLPLNIEKLLDQLSQQSDVYFIRPAHSERDFMPSQSLQSDDYALRQAIQSDESLLDQSSTLPQSLPETVNFLQHLLPQSDDVLARPLLRHHIAHFCPNLDVARECIRHCMEIGKPAFCGKDHKCYCGHSYGSPGEVDASIDPEDVHSQYKDLYTKYFGPQS